jgi:DNA-binding response OmpR family regulator
MYYPSRKSVLVLEDQAIIAIDIEDILTEAGFQVAAIISSGARALAWLESHRPDVVIVDVELDDGPCIEVAKALVSKSIPFVVFSANMPSAALDPVFSKGRWVEKPAACREVVSALGAAVGRNMHFPVHATFQ